jgi:hypothetical protein
MSLTPFLPPRIQGVWGESDVLAEINPERKEVRSGLVDIFFDCMDMIRSYRDAILICGIYQPLPVNTCPPWRSRQRQSARALQQGKSRRWISHCDYDRMIRFQAGRIPSLIFLRFNKIIGLFVYVII